jgi:hypothetical protein
MSTQSFSTPVGLWLRVQANVSRDPKIGRLADLLDINHVQAVGHVVMTWGAVAEHAVDGDVSEVGTRTLEQWAGWTGQKGAYDAAFRELFVEDDHIAHWSEYQGQLLIVRAKQAKRMRDLRTRQAAEIAAHAPAPKPAPAPAAPAPTPEPKPARQPRTKKSPSSTSGEAPAPKTSHLSPIERVLKELNPHAVINFGRLGGEMKPLFDAGHDGETIAAELKACKQFAGQFYSATKFHEMFGTWQDQWAAKQEQADSRDPVARAAKGMRSAALQATQAYAGDLLGLPAMDDTSDEVED